MTDETKKRLLDALKACQAIAAFTEGVNFSDYEDEANLLLRSGVERQLGIVGEAMRRAEGEDPDLIDRLPELRQIVGLRNRIIHGYDSVDDEIVWDVVQNKIPALITQLSALLAEDDA